MGAVKHGPKAGPFIFPVCPVCNGTGKIDDKVKGERVCLACNGNGEIKVRHGNRF